MAAAAASVIVDITLGVVTQIFFTLLGLVLLVEATGRTSLVGPTLIGALLGIAAIAGFYIAQRLGMFRFVSVIIARLVKSPEWSSLVQRGETLDHAVREFYGRRRGVRVLRLDNSFAHRQFRRNFYRTPRARRAPDVSERAHSPKHGHDG